MLLSTDVLLEDERARALAVVPWRLEIRPLTGRISSALKNKAVDLIDAAIGPNHVRAALVATFEGIDTLQQATMDLAESVARELVFQRIQPVDPLRKGELLAQPEDPTRLAFRFSRFAVEDSAVRTAAGIDHLANAYLRFAWEANATREEEVRACGFDPTKQEPRSWSSVEDVRRGLAQGKQSPLGLLRAFQLTAPMERLIDADPVRRSRGYRHAIVHRARPEYRETPPFGRSSLWAQERFSITLRDQEEDRAEAPDAPTLGDRRELVGASITEGLTFAQAMWDFALRWLSTVGVEVRHDADRDETNVSTTFQPGVQAPRFPREQRDPGPFLTT